MSTEQQMIYECSRKTAEKKVSNSEWINVWNDGIQLNRGDTVRLLGSFISEDGDSSDIQVLENTSFTMEHMPYINIDTVRFEDSISGTKTHVAQYQMRFGDIGSPAYSTSSYGEEPPYHILNGTPREQNDSHSFAVQLREPVGTGHMDWYSDLGWYDMYLKSIVVNPTSETGINYNGSYDFAVNDVAEKMGCYFDTNTGVPKAPTIITTSDTPAKTYLVPTPTDKTLSDFTLKNLEHQYYISHLCKLIYFPIFQGVYVESWDGATGVKAVTHEFEDNDYLEVGDYISTYFVSSSSQQQGDESTSAYTYDPATTFGEVQWGAGPRSVVGKVMATSIKFVDVPDPLTGLTVSMELQGVYVYEFVNPGSYKNQNDIKTWPRHGSAQYENGYNLNRNDNRNSGVSYQAYPLNTTSTASPGPSTHIDYPYRNSFLPKNYEVQRVGKEVYGQTDCPLDSTQNINENMNLETNTSLSFLWSCRGTDMRPFAPDSPSYTDGSQTHATSWVYPETVLGTALPITVFSSFLVGSTIIDIIDPPNKIKTESEIVFGGSPNIKVKMIYQFPGWTRLYLYGATAAAGNAGDGMTYLPNTKGIYWYPRQYTCEIREFDKAHRYWFYNRTGLDSYNNWGAIVKTNPDNDNIESYTPTGPYKHRLYIPFTQQTVGPQYKVRNFGSGNSYGITYDPAGIGKGKDKLFILGAENYALQPAGAPNTVGDIRLRQNFGISCGRGRGALGNSINTNAQSKPVPYLLTDTSGWNHNYIGLGASYINQDQGNSYNDSVCSIHFQRPLDGSQQFRQADNQTDIEAKLWEEDLIYVKKYKTEFKPKPGYYNYQQVAEDLNRQLHYNWQDYKNIVGGNTTVNLRQRQRGVAPNVINGNFVHTNLPDVTYGFMPLTQDLYEQDIVKWNLNGINTYRTQCVTNYLQTSTPTNQIGNLSISTYDDNIQLYFIPFNKNSVGVNLAEDDSLQLFKLNGAKLIPESNTLSMDHQDPQAMMTNRTVDILNTMTYLGGGSTTDMRSYRAGVSYQSRTAFNNFYYGGCAKIFVGSVNPSFEIDADISRMIFKFLYTPYRPATDDSGTALTLVSGQAVPSAIIDSYGNGGITDSLSGIYIRDLAASQITQLYSPLDFLGFSETDQYPTIDNDYVENATSFWNTLGFTNNQLTSYSSNTPDTPFLFFGRDFIINNILYNIAELDISSNASNPFYSYCSLWLPPLQYSVEVDSNEIVADRQPLTQNSPFYLIGSDFPGKHYFGNKGTKLPVMGVCSRQFTSFGFAFDLSESAIQWTIEEDVFLTSIHTKIYNNDMTVPLNLDDNSSIIYAITKSQYYKQPSQEDLQLVEKEMLQNTIPPVIYTPQMFEYPNQLNYEAPLFYDEDEDYDE
tara:strand:- start:465 stop:4577 length:4113 start_codon:yes stop_codon:yes gene_type:complete